MKWPSIVLMIVFLHSFAQAFDAPACGDPWYYQSDDRGFAFMIPDKAQHYWGSYALSALGSKCLGDKVGILVAFTFGFLWEYKDSKTLLGAANGGVVGFSYKDLIADGLGVMSLPLNRSKTYRMWIDYSTAVKRISLNISMRM